jgi:hypothetical protein
MCFAHNAFMCFAWISEQKAIISLYSINLSVFISEAECLLRGTNWVFKSDSYSFVLRRLKLLAICLHMYSFVSFVYYHNNNFPMQVYLIGLCNGNKV